MSWTSLDHSVQEVAETILTPKQLEAWQLELAGHGTREIAYRLDLARSTVADRITAAHRQLRRNGVRMRRDGSYYLEESA